MEKETICEYPQLYHELPHRKCVLLCCSKCPSVYFPDQETDDQYSETRPSIKFYIYHIIAHCTTHVRLLLNERIFFACVNRIMIQENP